MGSTKVLNCLLTPINSTCSHMMLCVDEKGPYAFLSLGSHDTMGQKQSSPILQKRKLRLREEE